MKIYTITHGIDGITIQNDSGVSRKFSNEAALASAYAYLTEEKELMERQLLAIRGYLTEEHTSDEKIVGRIREVLYGEQR